MSHDKAIQSGKEWRKPYRGAARFDHSCRNHGDCGWCMMNRLHVRIRDERATEEQMNEAGQES